MFVFMCECLENISLSLFFSLSLSLSLSLSIYLSLVVLRSQIYVFCAIFD